MKWKIWWEPIGCDYLALGIELIRQGESRYLCFNLLKIAIGIGRIKNRS